MNQTVASEKELRSHIVQVVKKFDDEFLKDSRIVESKLYPHIHLNKRVLVEAIKHARLDIERMSSFHIPKNCRLGKSKYAGFLSKWIAKMVPFYIEDGHPLSENMYLLNSYFAFWVFRSFLDKNIPEKFHIYLIYSLHFRDERGETLALLALTFQSISPPK